MKLPLLTHLHIFQLEEYQPARFLSWWIKHPLTFSTTDKKPLVFTFKAKLLTLLSLLLYFSFLILSFLFLPSLIAFVLALILFLLPFPLLFLALCLLKPYELLNRRRVIYQDRQKILHHPQLTTIAITGSYGKTSTKNFLFHLLDHHQPTLKSPHSYNTVFGLHKVLKLELTDSLKYFVTEFGAYQIGEIKELTHQIPPNFGILTAIGPQHLDRFGSLSNIIQAKFELVNALKPSHCLLNWDNSHIRQELKKRSLTDQVHTYSLKSNKAKFYISDYKLSPQGCRFTLHHHDQAYQFQTQLFGTVNLQNLTAALAQALLLKVPVSTLKKALTTLAASPHRLQLKKVNQATIIDNTYSSNQAGFTQIIKDLKNLPGKKALLTPGLIELGEKEASIHQKLGQQAAEVFDTIILVGKSSRTQALNQGIKKASLSPTVSYLDKTHQKLWQKVKDLASTHSWILLENDLPDQY